MISVIIVTYNEENNIKECLDSLIDQSKKPDEIILVDDGSTDNTLEIVKDYQIKIVKTKHKERSHARNVGWKSAINNIIIYAEADSVFDKVWIEEISNKFDQGADAVIDRRRMKDPISIFQKVMDAQFDIRYMNYQPFSAWAFRKGVLSDVGGFDESMNQSEDRELGKRLLDKEYKILLANKAIQYHKGEPQKLIEYLRRAFSIEAKRIGGYYKKFPQEKPIGKLINIFISISLIALALGWWQSVLLFLMHIIIQYLAILVKIIYKEKGLQSAKTINIIYLALYRLLRNYSAAAGYIIGNL